MTKHQHFLTQKLVFISLILLLVPVREIVHDIGILVCDNIVQILNLSHNLVGDGWVV